MGEISTRISQARKASRLTQQQLARATGKSRAAVAQWENGLVYPRPATLELIAKATGKPLAWLQTGIDETTIGMEVAGVVAAGIWRDDSLGFEPYHKPVAPHPAYPAEAQRLWRVAGTSMNRVVDDGAYVHTVNILQGGLTPQFGDYVIVTRQRHGTTEYTIKRIVGDDGGWSLQPESNDPRWQNPVPIAGDEETEIAVLDIVLAVWRPLGRIE